MKTIAIISQKGGSGKTTLALHLAVAAEAAGKVTVLLDLDPQASATGWKDSRKGETPEIMALPSTRLAPALRTASEEGFDLALIDTAPSTERDAATAARAADLVLVPCRAAILDLRAIEMTAELVKLTGKPAFAVLNAVPPHAPRIEADAREAISGYGLNVAPCTLQHRAAYAHALTVGQVAQEYEPKGKAAGEVAALYEWLDTITQ
jgi:chromosome partitioning protein